MREQTKKYAYFPVQDRQVLVSEALHLRNNGKIEIDGKNPVFFDFKNPAIRSGVYPVSSSSKKITRGAYYRYFSKENKKQILSPKEMTNAHLFFQMMFLQLKKFRIEDKKNKRKVRVDIKSAEMEYYIKVDNKRGILIDVLLDIKQTYPYSYKYLWNNKLAIEVKVTHAVDPKKKCILRDHNISTYEATVPKAVRAKIPEAHDLLDSEELRQKKIDELTKIYANHEKWTLFGNFIVNSKVENENKENYILLSQVETELANYKKEKEQLFEEIKKYKEYKLQLTKDINELKKHTDTLEKEFKVNQGFLKDSQRNKQLVKKLSTELAQKEQKIESLKKKNNSLKNSISKFEGESFLEWVKRKFFDK
ncbi:hypothetical protein [Virgibacillus pantothenticus]|uniref:hypothetical protein n=1 Tax=Virgibacillus pantothenticus TaxID=1473 RepID=UPI0025B22B90|nr:hypothetical protein [Virgibacillus pantothenticus]